MKITSRKEAIDLGLYFYFTGIPCKHGHISRRKTNNRLCTGCIEAIDHKADYQKRRDQQLEKKKEHYRENKPTHKERLRASHQKNRESRLKSQREYYRKNKAKAFERAAKRRSLVSKATPSWADREKISKMYDKAMSLGLHVDHIIPLNSPLVCGLHSENNLQLLEPSENIKKGNRYWPDMP